MSQGKSGDGGLTQANVALVMAALTVLFALVDWLAGLTTSVAAALALNYYHTEPFHTLRVTDSRDVLSIVLLLVLGLTVSAATAFRVRRDVHHIRAADAGAAADELRSTLVKNNPAPLVWSAAIATTANDLGLVLARVERSAPADIPTIGRPAGSYQLLDADLVLPGVRRRPTPRAAPPGGTLAGADTARRVGTVDARPPGRDGVRRHDRAGARHHRHGAGQHPTGVVKKILVVDDERQIRRALGLNLTAHDYQVVYADTGESAMQAAATEHPDLVLLDLGLPGLSGIGVIEALRGWSTMPIIVLTARDDEHSKVVALDAGADDYITKPFGMAELLARIRAALRRAAEPGSERPEVVTPWLRLDFAAHRAFVGDDHDREVHLTATEWQIVDYLARNEGRLITQRQLITAVWGPTYSPNPNLLRVHMTNIRRKLEQHPGAPTHFITDSGVGYRFENRAAVPAARPVAP